MGDVLPQLGLVLILVAVNAVLAGSELALVTLREGQLQRLEQRSPAGATLARLARDPNRFLATIQVGITLAGLLASAVAAVSLAEPLVPGLAFLGGAAEPVAVFAVTLVLGYLTLVLGELAPKRLALQRAERWGLFVARPLAFLSAVTRPAVWLLSHSTDVVVRILGGNPSQQREDVTEEELRDMVAVQTAFSPQQRMIIDGAFEIAERTLREVLRPRPDVFALDSATPCDRALRALAASGHSRAPVVTDGNLDDVVGVVHLRDLLDCAERTCGQVAAPAWVVPETVGVLDALRGLQARRTQLAVIVDEHGAATGIITVEDLVEELVGEIYDESDRDVVGVHREADGSVTLPGRFPVHDLPDVGVDAVPAGDYATVAGLVLDLLGKVPQEPGDRAAIPGWELEVTAVGRHTVDEVRLIPVSDPDSQAGHTS